MVTVEKFSDRSGWCPPTTSPPIASSHQPSSTNPANSSPRRSTFRRAKILSVANGVHQSARKRIFLISINTSSWPDGNLIPNQRLHLRSTASDRDHSDDAVKHPPNVSSTARTISFLKIRYERCRRSHSHNYHRFQNLKNRVRSTYPILSDGRLRTFRSRSPHNLIRIFLKDHQLCV